jgi:transcriptional regulator with XRE-family HTH domain
LTDHPAHKSRTVIETFLGGHSVEDGSVGIIKINIYLYTHGNSFYRNGKFVYQYYNSLYKYVKLIYQNGKHTYYQIGYYIYMKMAPELFLNWLKSEMNARNLGIRDTARLVGVSHPTISEIVTNGKMPSYEVCIALAMAFRKPQIWVLRLASLLPMADDDAEWEIWKAKLAKLSPENRERFLRLMETELQYQEEQEERAATRKRKTAPLPNLGG